MFRETKAYSGFAVDDLDAARTFYGETLGIETEVLEDGNLLVLHLAGGRDTLVYHKPDFAPATYTILNFEVADVDAAVDGLIERGVELEHYDGFEQDDKALPGATRARRSRGSPILPATSSRSWRRRKPISR